MIIRRVKIVCSNLFDGQLFDQSINRLGDPGRYQSWPSVADDIVRRYQSWPRGNDLGSLLARPPTNVANAVRCVIQRTCFKPSGNDPSLGRYYILPLRFSLRDMRECMNTEKPYSGESHMYHCSSEKMGI
jgi:hypothetical protein